jgi:hypothetical protein
VVGALSQRDARNAPGRASCALPTSERGQMAEQIIDKWERYVGYATKCLQLAKVISDNQSRLVLKDMASKWLKLADEA